MRTLSLFFRYQFISIRFDTDSSLKIVLLNLLFVRFVWGKNLLANKRGLIQIIKFLFNYSNFDHTARAPSINKSFCPLSCCKYFSISILSSIIFQISTRSSRQF